MRVLIVASYNKGHFAPFIVEQAAELAELGCCMEFFGITGKGIKGYLKAYPALKRKIKEFEPDIIHAHYGLSGLLACLQRRVPVVTTYHGSDINDRKVLPFSKLAMRLSAFNIFVSRKTMEIAGYLKRGELVPCGIAENEIQAMPKAGARERMGLDTSRKYVLFAGAFDNTVKNYPLAEQTMSLLPGCQLIELKGYDRSQVTMLMRAADAILMTSHTEGSPQVIKEAMMCGCPVVSVDVGDVSEVVEGVAGCFVCDRTAEALAGKLEVAMAHGETGGRDRIVSRGLTGKAVADRIIEIYKSVI